MPSDQVLGGAVDFHVVWEVEALAPVDDLAVDVLPVIGAKGRPADEALEHDCAE